MEQAVTEMNPILEQVLRENGFQQKAGVWSRQNLVSAGLATMVVRPSTELDRKRITPVTYGTEFVCVIEVGDDRIEQLRSADQVLSLLAIFLTG